MTPYPPLELLTGAELLAYVAGSTVPSARPDDVAWAEQVAAAVNAAVTVELERDPATLPPQAIADLTVAALAIGAERFKRREAPWGVAGFDVSGGAIRLSSDDLIAGRTAIDRWSSTGGVGVG